MMPSIASISFLFIPLCATAIEYALIAALIAFAAILAFRLLVRQIG